MRKSNLRATAGWQALALLGAGAMFATPAAAQDADADAAEEAAEEAIADAEETADEAIVVTGSRIVRPELEAPSPVTTVDSEQFDLTGTVTVETLLNELPQLIPGNTRTSNNQGGEDFSTLDLRGLGPNRTLILVDGERVPASSTTGVVDIGTIPAGLIERVDVVTGGASAVYGSDAMAGVVNFILKDNYEGLEVSSQYSITDHGDGGQFNIQGLLGGNFGDDRGNMTFFASYYTRDSIGQGDRDVTRDAGVLYYNYATGQVEVADHLVPPNANQGYFFPGGSATPPWGWASNNSANPFTIDPDALELATGNSNFQGGNYDTNCDGTPNAADYTTGNVSFTDGGALTPRAASGLCHFADRSVGSSRFNFNPLNFLVTPYERLGFAVTARYDITDAIRLKVLANYVDSEQVVELAPTPAGFSTAITVPGDSPLIPDDLRFVLDSRPDPDAPFLFNRRFFETGPRIGTYDSKTATIRGTLSGPLTDTFNWDFTASYGRTDATQRGQNNINRTAVEQGLAGCENDAGVVNGPGVLPGCVPVDIFGLNTLTPAMVSFVRIDTKETRFFDQVRIAGNITGNIVELPAGPLGVAIGAEVRTERGETLVDDGQRTGNIIGFNATQDQAGKVNVKEIYGEVRVPILADMPFFHELTLEAGARYSDYSSVGGLFNWKIGAQWAPVSWLKIRGIYNKAARAPSIVELFQNGDQGFPSYTDPCNDNGFRTAQALAICQAQSPGFNFTGFQQGNGQVQAFAFGEPSLGQETAKTWTIGAVITPDFGLGRFSLTVDYYNITIEDIIITLGAGFYINDCYGNGVVASCNRITRNTVTGEIDAVNTSRTNQGEFKSSGIDFALNYAVPFADLGIGIPGRIRIQELLSWSEEISFGGQNLSGATVLGIGGSFPEWKSTLTVAYDSASFTAQVRWNYNSDLDDAVFCNPGGNCAADLPGLSYFDLSLRKKIGDNFEITGIVQNLFNQKAQKSVGGFFAEGGVDISYWNPVILGRTFTIQARVKM